MKKFILFLVLVLGFSTIAICGNPNHIELPNSPHSPDDEVQKDEMYFAVPSRTGHMIGTWEYEINILGIFKKKVTGIRCDSTPNVICVMKEGVPTETAIRSANGSVITVGDFSHEEVEPQSDGSTIYLFYFNVE